MRNTTLAILLIFFIVRISVGQENGGLRDFVEVGLRTSNIIETSLLRNTIYNEVGSEVARSEQFGFTSTGNSSNLTINVRFGKSVSNKIQVLSEIGYLIINEDFECFCHVCGKINTTPITINVRAINGSIGGRYNLLNLNDLYVSVDGLIKYSITTNISDHSFYGFLIQPLVGYELGNGYSVNLKYGFEQSFKDYKKKETFAEVAINYAIGLKSKRQ